MRAALPKAPGARWGVEEKPAGMPAWMPGKRALGGALLFGYFLLGTQEKVTRSFQDRKLLML
ncbi:hypothetical protein GCM10010872_11190 [Dyella flava]|nr:hypothetical protein GCM10010872_11190 [Dyella flava]